jgi:hypothetical protein
VGRRWDSFRQWAHRIDQSAEDWLPPGIELVDESARGSVLAAAWEARKWGVVVVRDEDFVPRAVANGRFARSARDVREMGSLGYVQYAIRASDGEEGVTASSLEKELEWRRSAGRLRRIGRAIASVVHYV